MEVGINYDIHLPDDVSNVLASDFWIMEHLNKSSIPKTADPLKFSATVSVFVEQGECIADINLITYRIEAPSIVNIRKSHILQIKSISDDFVASCIVISKRFSDNLFLFLRDNIQYSIALRHNVVKIDQSMVTPFNHLFKQMSEISADTTNPNAYQAQVLTISAFFHSTGYKCYRHISDNQMKSNNHIPDRFITLVQQHFKNERFLDFYAAKLGITPKHLSRKVKAITGYTAVEWIERYVILEAKVLLKSTNLSVQQISNELNFPSQSFFGKYFKKNIGMSPKEFRNK